MATAKSTWDEEHGGKFVYLRRREEAGGAFRQRSFMYG